MEEPMGAAPNWAEIVTAIVAAVASVGGLGSRWLYTILDGKISAKGEQLNTKIDEQRLVLNAKIDAQRIDLLQEMAEDREAMRSEIITEGKNFGESLAAIREHLGQMGFFIRDNFVRRDEFQTAMLQLNQSIDTLRDSNDKKLEGIRAAVEARLEKVTPAHTR